jgi:hypothetical protein
MNTPGIGSAHKSKDIHSNASQMSGKSSLVPVQQSIQISNQTLGLSLKNQQLRQSQHYQQ